MLETLVCHPSELSDRDTEAWSGFQAASPFFESPLLGPAFAKAVGEVRSDARVAVYRRDGRPVAFLPHHRRPWGFARPIGAPFSDYHALVGAPDDPLGAVEALRGARLAAFRFGGLIDPAARFAGAVASTDIGYRVVAHGPAEAARVLGGLGRNGIRNQRRYRRKLERLGPLRIVADPDRLAFEALLEWKRDQIRRTGMQDFLAADWVRSLLGRLFDAREGPFQGLALGLYAGERLVCGHFGVRQGGVYHPWIGASDPAFRGYSAGFIHQWMAIEAMPSLGLGVYDLGPGAGHWKARFANDLTTIGAGLAIAGGWRTPPVLAALPLAERARRRLDQIAATQLTFSGRLKGVAEALGGYGRRLESRNGATGASPGRAA
jgi:CelD/BcsL family acetyltransferase involved in cellulose biosynthesis